MIPETVGPPPAVAAIASAVSDSISQMVQQAAAAAAKVGGADSRVNSLYAAAVGGTSVLHIVASLIGWTGDPKQEKLEKCDTPKLINPTTTLVAALLIAAMAPEATYEGDVDSGRGIKIGVNVTFGPDILLDAIQQAERLTGRSVDGFIQPSLMRSLKTISQEANDPMSRFLAQKRPTSGNLH